MSDDTKFDELLPQAEQVIATFNFEP